VALNAAERHIDAGTAALVVSIAPLLIVVFAGTFLGEGFPPRLMAGCGMALAGSLLIGIATAEGSLGSAAVWGVVLCLIAAVLYAIGVTLEKPALRYAPGLSVTCVACAFGAIATAPFAPQFFAEVSDADLPAIGVVIYLGLFPTSIAFLTWAQALARTNAGRLGATMYLVAPTSIGLAWILLGEAPPPLAIVGGSVAIAGVTVARSLGGRK
jgi:drug/metabolite transporter (DMT)-like permease